MRIPSARTTRLQNRSLFEEEEEEKEEKEEEEEEKVSNAARSVCDDTSAARLLIATINMHVEYRSIVIANRAFLSPRRLIRRPLLRFNCSHT